MVKTLDILSCFMMYTPPTVSESEASTLILNMKYAKVGRANKRVCLTHVMLYLQYLQFYTKQLKLYKEQA